MKQFIIHLSDLTQFAKNSLDNMRVIHYGDLTNDAQDRFCTWFGADVDLCFPVCKKEEVIG